MVEVLAVVGALTVLAVFLRLSGFKGLYMGVEFHDKQRDLSESSEAHLASDSRPLLRNRRASDGKLLK
jgi:hypothetical protein